MFITIRRTFKEALKSFYRNGWLTLATMSILMLSLYVFGTVYIVTYSVDNILQNVQNKVNISVYFKLDTPENEIMEIGSQIQKENQNINSIEYISREKALENFKRDNANDPVIMQSLEEIGSNPLLSALVIRANESNQYQKVIDYVNNAEFKDKISRSNYGKNKDMIENLNNKIFAIRRAGISVGAILIITSILVTFNTIGMSIYAQRKEIEIMRLVGASNIYIRLPIVFEGIIYGALASLLSMLVLFVTLKLNFVTSGVSGIPSENLIAFYLSHFGKIISIQLFIGVILGVFSSIIAMRKYLRV